MQSANDDEHRFVVSDRVMLHSIKSTIMCSTNQQRADLQTDVQRLQFTKKRVGNTCG